MYVIEDVLSDRHKWHVNLCIYVLRLEDRRRKDHDERAARGGMKRVALGAPTKGKHQRGRPATLEQIRPQVICNHING